MIDDKVLILMACCAIVVVVAITLEGVSEVTKIVLKALIWPVLALVVAFFVYPGNVIFSKSLASVSVGDGACLLVSAVLAYYGVTNVIGLFVLWRAAE